LKVKKMELQLLRLTEEKALLEDKLKRQSLDTKGQRNSSQILTEKNKNQYEVSRGKENMPNNAQSGARDTSVKSAKMKEKELDDGKNSDMSRKGSFMTNVSRRYQECDDENEEEGLEKLSSKSSCENLSQTYSRNKKELLLEKRNTQDIKSLERFGQPNSTKSTKELEKKNNR
jgi:hypothetical protein